MDTASVTGGEHKGKEKTCRVCGEEVAAREDGKPFVACAECGFPVCRPCYEYERSEGTQCCPQCNTRYKRHKGNIMCCVHVINRNLVHKIELDKNVCLSVSIDRSQGAHGWKATRTTAATWTTSRRSSRSRAPPSRNPPTSPSTSTSTR